MPLVKSRTAPSARAKTGSGILLESSTSTQCPSWVLSRALCCFGVMVLVQNIMLLHFGSRAMASGASEVRGDDTLQAGRMQVEMQDKNRRISMLEAQLRSRPSSGSAPDALQESALKEEYRKLKMELDSSQAMVRSLQKASGANLAGSSDGRDSGATIAVNDAQDIAPALVAHSTIDPNAVAVTSGSGLGPLSSLLTVPREELQLFGNPVPTSVRIAVGFGSVRRVKDYVLDTVGLILGLKGRTVLTPAERDSIVIVAHLADFNVSWVSDISNRLRALYPDVVSSGRFHALHAPETLYPHLDVCPPFCSYNDDARRVRWRSKQNVDYAFLMYYSQPLAPYYLQIEDDILCTSHWVGKITQYLADAYPEDFLSKENAPWRLIDFSQLGFIGKMFQSSEVTRMAQFLLLFYDQMPCDILLNEWMRAMTQGARIDYWRKHPSLFQHVGIYRSLGGFQPLQERKFGKLVFDNPAGKVHSNMTLVRTYTAKFAYFPGGEPTNRKDLCDFSASPAHNIKDKHHRCWFWAETVAAGDHLTIVFGKSIDLRAVFIQFGHEKHPEELLLDGIVEVAGSLVLAQEEQQEDHFFGTSDNYRLASCGTYYPLMEVQTQDMVYWEEGTSSPQQSPVQRVHCLRIAARSSQREGMIIQQIQVRTQRGA